ncbi:MAG: nucleotidyltransferase domain-containing protein [Puniceicoccales bacterium]|jgi:predicted nucleotidyltransferase|nr:nucleotidyltransferase domain-containing protein [Puniceicoccales bacterium]
MIKLTTEELAIVHEILSRYLSGTGANVYVFGSRITEWIKPFSDLDLAIECDEATAEKLPKLRAAFSDSDFPYFVDLVDLHRCNPDFRDIVNGQKAKLITFTKAGNGLALK